MTSKFDNIFGINEETTAKLQNMKQAEEKREPVQSTISLNLDTTKDGTVKKTLKNVELILQKDPVLKDKIKFNLASQVMEVVDDIKFPVEGGVAIQNIKKGQVTDDAANAIQSYLSCNPDYAIEPSQNLIITAINVTGMAQQFDPLREYFDGLKWDGKDRLSNVMHDFLGAEKTPANLLAFKHWMMAAVAKVYNKQQKVDECLDAVGGQGIGKTSFFKNIAPLGMYAQGFQTFTNKDDLSRLIGVLIANDDEMTASARSSFEEIKSFITNTQVVFRAPYGHFNRVYNQSFVLCRTSNEVQHLSDKSGDRRFMSIECGVVPKKYDVNDPKHFSKKYIDQLWAQAKHLYDDAKGSIKLTNEQYEILRQGRQHFLKTSDLEDTVLDTIDQELSNTNFISNEDMKSIMGVKMQRIINNRDMNKVRYYMSYNGWQAGARVKLSDGSRPRGFKRIKEIKTNPKVWNEKDWIEYEKNNRIPTDKEAPRFGVKTNHEGQEIASSDSHWNYVTDYKKYKHGVPESNDKEETQIKDEDLPF